MLIVVFSPTPLTPSRLCGGDNFSGDPGVRVNFTVKGEPGGGGGGGLSARARDVSAMVASLMVLVMMSVAVAHTAAMVTVSILHWSLALISEK